MAGIYIIIVILCILIEAFFSGSEIAIISLNRIRLRILAEARDRKAVIIHRMLSNPERLLGTTLAGTNLSVVTASAVFTRFIYQAYGVKSEWVTTLILSPAILIFGELIPKAIFSQMADRITFYLGSVLRLFWQILFPFVWLVNRFVNIILRPFIDEAAARRSPFVTKEEIKYLIRESESEGEIDPYERSIIYKIFDFGKKKVKDVMRGLGKLAYLSDSDTIEALIEKARGSGYSRFPIRSATGRFLGIVNILDVIYEEDKKKPLVNFVRPVEYISTETDIDHALFMLQSQKQHIALVQDSYGDPIGFFTMEDLLQELVGEI